jgi:hypothetical protein
MDVRDAYRGIHAMLRYQLLLWILLHNWQAVIHGRQQRYISEIL